MTNLIKRLRLARMLQMFGEITTAEGVTFDYEGDLDVNVEVYTPGEDGDLVPVPDGTYEYDNKLYTVEGGIITVIADKDSAASIVEDNPEPAASDAEPNSEDAPVEEKPAEEEPVEEPVTEEPAPAEEPAVEEEPAEEEPTAEEEPAAEEGNDVDALKAENEELKAKIDELNAKIAELEAKIAEAEEPAEDPADQKFKKQEPVKDGNKNEYNLIAALRKQREEE